MSRTIITGVVGALFVVLSACGGDPAGSEVGGSGQPAEGRSAERDSRLVGRWRRTQTHRISDPRYPVSTVSETYSTLNADGTFVLQNGGTSVNVPTPTGSTGGHTGSGGALRGRWKTANRILYYRLEGAEQWYASGQYTVQPRHLMIVTVTGQKQLWER
ncbi:MAG: hypothetical protein CMJ83_07735 [Planctomycetes bacterium]|nr:hypothetical protein [Planctomycetota bacterium]